MAGKNSKLKARLAHKQLLVAESELNRTLLVLEGKNMLAGISGLAKHAKHLGSVVSLAGVLFAGFSAWRNGKAAEPAKKRGWFSTVIGGVRKGAALWFALRESVHRKSDA